ncbi:hypothetical protein AM500_12275 [Bacillus sp. FJAT-18017]|uniref:hypothetical protein n=1 Tax=Bacillus sp. FJAT-18017 TaxID=1705566 RepID=UPI0006AFAF00|nr:hypothetical protein [Bacillus sp. FJAT-18017]ALC90476.1 hypothetical protein AM500_12275 [Bacillus sp. FJAT-18017]
MRQWEKALVRIQELVTDAGSDLEWILVGSVGSVLQGAEMEPGDIDVYVRHQEDVSRFAELFKSYSLETSTQGEPGSDWYSSREVPIFTQTFPSGFSWTKGRWKIEEFEVEAVHIGDSAGIPDNLKGDGIWEGGRYIWDMYKEVAFQEYKFLVVPLEIQLESNLRRGRQDRAEAILDALRTNGYDSELLSKALSSKHLESIDLMKESNFN